MSPQVQNQIDLKIPSFEFQQPEYVDYSSGERYPAKVRKLPSTRVTIMWSHDSKYRPLPFEVPSMAYMASSESKRSTIKVQAGSRSYRYWPVKRANQKIDPEYQNKVNELGGASPQDPHRIEFVGIAAPIFGH